MLTTSVLFVGSVFTVVVAIAQFGLVDALGCGIWTSLWTDEFVLGASDGRAIAFICSVGTILVAIAMPASRNTSLVLAAELTTMAWGEI